MFVLRMVIIIQLFFWIVVLLACLRVLLRGRVYAIQSIYTEISFLFYILLAFTQAYSSFFIGDFPQKDLISSRWMEWLLILFAVSFSSIAIHIIIHFADLRNQYLVWGVVEKEFLGVIDNILEKDHLKYKGVENNILLEKYPDDIYHYSPFVIHSAGINFSAKNAKKGKADPCKIMSKVRGALQEYSMNISSKVVLILFIMFTCFVLYANFQQLL